MLHIGQTPREMWVSLVREGQTRAHVQLSEMEESYTVFMLERFLLSQELLAVTLATEYLESQLKGRAERKDTLSYVGDASLLIAGLFPNRARSKHVSVSYFTDMSKRCFFELSTLLEAARRYAEARQYHELGFAVDRLAYVLYCTRWKNSTVRELLK